MSEIPKRVAIIGAGPSGLAAIKHCLENGLAPVCFERSNSGLGGLWNYQKDTKNCIHESSVVKTSKAMMQFSDFEIPEDWPEFLPHSKVKEYLKMYSKEFGLEKYIKYERTVYSIKPQTVGDNEDEIETGKWEIIYKKKERKGKSGNDSLNLSLANMSLASGTSTGNHSTLASPPPSRSETPDMRMASIDIDRGVSIDYTISSHSKPVHLNRKKSYHIQFSDRSSEEYNPSSFNSSKMENHQQSISSPPPKSKGMCKRDVFDYVMVCTGHHWNPRMPEFPGLDNFKGQKIHSSQYNVPYPYKDEKVLVVGVGNSGLDISSDLAPHSAIVYLSSRSGTWVTPRTTLFGLPTDHLSTRAAHSIPRFALNYALESLITLHHGDMEKYGLKPKHKFLEATPVVGTNILQLIESGKVIVKPNVSRFTERGVEFEDGTWQEIDSVIFCTGFKVENPFMDDEIMGKEEEESDRVRLYKHIFPTTHENIAFIGLVQPNGSLLPVAELQSRWASLVFSGKHTLPSQKERRDISDMDWLAHRQKYAEKDRFSIAVDQVEYMDSIGELMKVKPDLWKLWSSRKTWGLALRVTFGPVVSAQYRLEGEGAKRELAEAAIARACDGLDFGNLVRVRAQNSS